MAGSPPIEIRGLVKRYGEILAVDDVDLTVNQGDVFGYLGPNGAGKTTSLRMMLGLIRPSSGSVRIFGRDPQLSVDALAGVAGFVEAPSFYPYMSGRANLELCAAFDGGDGSGRIDEVLDTVDLAARAKDKVKGYSHGMRQRLGIASALLRDPKLLLLDEPTTGLDPAGMRDMRELVRDLADRGITVLLSSHLMPEVEDLCNRVAVIRSGRIAYEGSLEDLRARSGIRYRLRTRNDAVARRVCEERSGIGELEGGRPDGLYFKAEDEDAVAALSSALAEAGAPILELTPRQASLEEVFFELTEGSDREAEMAAAADEIEAAA